jgi:hypothetical protein
MVSKKLKLLISASMLLSAGAFAQTEANNNGYMTGGYNVNDSSVIPNKKMGQQNEFWNHNSAFPAKPRNMWEIGVNTGIFTISGDVSSRPFTAPNFGVHVRKAFGYIFSLRAEYINTIGKGQNWKASENFIRNSAWSNGSATGYYAPYRTTSGTVVASNGGVINPTGARDIVFYNYKTNVQDLSLQGIFTLNNIRFHKAKTGIVLYGGGGIGATIFQAKVNAVNDEGDGKNYSLLFKNIANATQYKSRKDVIKALKDGVNGIPGMDDSYETPAQSNVNSNNTGTEPKLGKNTLKPSGTVLAGVAFKLGKRINLAIEDRWTFVKTDLLDGQQWQETALGDPAQTRDFDSYNYASIGLNFNLGGKAVEPLWWLNPLDYAYSELNNPHHLVIPKPVLDDTDGDGVIDQLDREPNTPAGCPVDTHGVTKDTDGDGVPDCKDKQLITPTECQPVNADGVGKCPDPECCKNPPLPVDGGVKNCPSDYPALSFKGNVKTLSADAKAMLATVAAKMKANPNCNITVNGYPEASKASQAVCSARVDAIKAYLVDQQGISADRISTNCEVGGGDKNTVDIKSN